MRHGHAVDGLLPATGTRAAPAVYEAPRLTLLGTLGELTRGVNTGGTDFIGPGSSTA
jgi:hypothetical protein